MARYAHEGARKVKKGSLTPYRVQTLPAYADTIYRDVGEPPRELLDRIEALHRKIAWQCGASAAGYRMLGYAQSWQEDVKTVLARDLAERRGESVDARALSREMELLLEIQLEDGTDHTNLHRWGSGAHYWGLHRDALARGELESAEMIFQPNG